eukprot:14662498-Heterocapsa_arctica.AAC.1
MSRISFPGVGALPAPERRRRSDEMELGPVAAEGEGVDEAAPEEEGETTGPRAWMAPVMRSARDERCRSTKAQ